MAQGFMAGFTTYENQSLSDIVEDIGNWIDYSEKTIEFFENTIDEIKNTAFYNKISYDYKSFMYEAIQICRTNIEDFKQVLNAIEQNQLTSEKVDLFFKIGKRAVSNSEENKKCFKGYGDERWHDYGNPDFHKVEDLYAKFGDYSATLWDVTNAAVRLRDYIDVPKEVTSLKYENKSINIGNGNTITKSAIGYDNQVDNQIEETKTEKWYSKIAWNIVVPIIVGLAVIIIAAWLGLEN